MANPNPLPMFGADGDDAANNDDAVPADSGALIRWEKAEGTASGNLGLLGVRTVVLCLVLCMGRVIQDGESACMHVCPTSICPIDKASGR